MPLSLSDTAAAAAAAAIASRYDNMTQAELFELNGKGGGWGKRAAEEVMRRSP